jgi:hypothetical protein
MKNMIGIILSITLVFILGGCASSYTTTQNKNTATKIDSPKPDKSKPKEPTQEELNEKLKLEATKADFVQLNGHEDNFKDKKLYAEGKISTVDYDKVMDLFPSFTLSQQEGTGYGMYHIVNILNVPNLKDGDTVKIYGTLDGKDTTGMTKITSTVIEKK